MTTLAYADMIALVADRSAAQREAADGNLDRPVPGCPGWTNRDLVDHLGGVQRFWAAAVTSGTRDAPPDLPDEEPSGDLLTWAALQTDALVDALRATPPDSGAWTWWGEPRMVGAIARHQVQEAAVHAWDAQEAVGRVEALPTRAAVDGVDEFLAIVERVGAPWPHVPTTVSFAADEADEAWLVELGAEGARVRRARAVGEATLSGCASDLVLALYRRRRPDVLRVDGDHSRMTQFLNWTVLD